MDRTAWIVVSLATIGLIGTFFWEQRQNEALLKYQQQQAAYAAQMSPTPVDSPPLSTTPGASQPTLEQTPEQNLPEKVEILENDVAKLHFSNNRGGLALIDLLTHKAEHGHPVELNSASAPAIGAISQTPNSWADGGYDLTTDSTSGTATLKRQLNGSVEVTKTYTLAKQASLKDDYQVKLAITFNNSGSSEFKVPGYFVSTGAAAPIHRNDKAYATQFDWYRDGKYNSIAVNWFDPGSLLGLIQTSPAKEVYLAPDNDNNPVKILWASVSNQYFATILAPVDIGSTHVWARRIQIPNNDHQPQLQGIQGALEIPGFQLAPGESKTVEFTIYGGPKEFNRLAKLPNNQADVMNFGWAKGISEMLLTVMNTLHAWVKSYALTIIIMTIIIRSLLWPLQNAATKSMRKMAQLSPIINELKEKHKDDPQRMQQETMKLYKGYGINPFGGCLPMLIQIPIFFGFYGMLDKAIELRNSPFLWVSDLSQPDTVFHFAGFPINVLPLVMTATQFWQMSITPKTGDSAQQRMFLLMPLIFLFICYNYASALALYWTAQNLFIVVQIYLTRNQMQAPLVKVPAAPAVANRKSYR